MMIVVLNGETLSELMCQYNLANAIMMRLTRVIDRAALTAIMSGTTLDMMTLEAAGVSAQAMEAAINDPAVRVVVRSDEISEKHSLRIERMRHGNVYVTSIDADVVLSND